VTEAAPEFLEIFQDEANARLDHIVDTLLTLEAGRAAPDAVDSLFRDAHTIKGGAAMLGLNEVRELAHAVEDVLGEARESGRFSPELTDPLLRAADLLRGQIEGSGEETADLLQELGASGTRVGVAPLREPAEPSRPPGPPLERRSIRVPAERLDRLLDLVGETMLHRRRLEHVLGPQEIQAPEELADELAAGERLLGELQDTAVEMRTLPFASIIGSFPRAVRDIAASEGKEVELVVTGAETELDRVILEGLSEALVHLLRNAVAHGIEPPQERERLGKPRQARVELRAEQRGRTVALTVADDGRGAPVDTTRLAQSGRESLVDVLAAPGYSTSREVTELSGRGIGLHVVKVAVEGFGGNIEIESEPGLGMQTTLLLPLTLALLDVLLVECGGQAFGVPLASVEQAVAVEDRLSLDGCSGLEVRGESLPLWSLAELIGLDAPEPPDGAPAVVVNASGRRIAALCDSLLGEEEVVVKSLGPLLSPLPGYLGASILGDGRIALLLDPSSLVRPREPRADAKPAPAARPAPGSTKILVVEDSFTVRELQRSILEAAGYQVATARGGREALARIEGDEQIGLVVTDIEMPDGDGLELVTTIRTHPTRSDLPVIILTTSDTEEDRRRGLAAGADAHFAKQTFDQRALLEAVEQLTRR